MSSENERFGDIMPVIIERIIRFERAETDAFIKQQNKQTKPIIEELQRAGILDENGDLAIPYRDEE